MSTRSGVVELNGKRSGVDVSAEKRGQFPISEWARSSDCVVDNESAFAREIGAPTAVLS